ncbi:preprotein translocase subunit YajC [Acidihalobacter ferrooxydans]|uniref:Sec translocon accessory complex subunit YajC n=1 Tax=Acidihalobacter ferrooxydans TaxID=1765967 RepID=A0A1P8UGT4_9GAMM|nr:preprotein translocase subunit YajC [Acidihalobacter ferrooxydans]APZ43052.1 preprotein translocase subunit YajC [Acidihalobacter ferrooxydans]
MSFFISNAYAADPGAATGSAGGGIELIIMIAIFFGLMYFMIIRPQSKRAKEHRKLLEALSKGDEVVTTGGVVGKVSAVGENFVEVEVSEGGPVLKVQKQAVTGILPKGTIKGL